jgi:3-oxoadipate enol-lactonase
MSMSALPPLLLLSSIGMTASMWAAQVPHLAGARRVLTVEHRGHGGAPAPPGPYTLAELGGDVLARMDAEGVARCDYAGLSLGGMVGMWLAVNAPERIRRLALVCTMAESDPGPWHQRATLVRAEGMQAVTDLVLSRWFTDEFRAAQPALVADLVAELHAVDDEGYAGCCEAIAGLDLLRDLGRVRAPTLVVAGAADVASPPVQAERIAAAIPGARLEVLPGVAHIAAVEAPDQVTALLVDHFAG